MDPVDSSEDSGLPSVIGDAIAMVPKGMKEKFLTAVAHIIGAAAAPAWYRKANDTVNAASSRKIVRDELAKAAAKELASNPDVIKREIERLYPEVGAIEADAAARALPRLLQEGARKQENRESIARFALEDLRSETTRGESEGREETEPSIDWLNKFGRFAEDISTEDMQRLWGKILAGEIKSAGSFSMRTLRFMSELDDDVATIFQKSAQNQISGNSIYAPHEEFNRGQAYLDMNALVDVGLIIEGPGHASKKFVVPDEGTIVMLGMEYGVVFPDAVAGAVCEVPVVLLTKVGREVLKLIDLEDEVSSVGDIAKKCFQRNSFPKAFLGKYTRGDGEAVFVKHEVKLWDSNTGI